MSNLLILAEFLNCKHGHTLDESAAHFGTSRRTIQRWIARLDVNYPGLKIDEFWDDIGAKRFRCADRSGFAGKLSLGKRDILSLWSLVLAAEIMRERGLCDDADALDNLRGLLLANAPHAHYKEIERQLQSLRLSEGTQAPQAENNASRGLLRKLRLAILSDRKVIVTIKGGGNVEGVVSGLKHYPLVCARLFTDGGEVVVPIEQMASLAGVDDVLHSEFLIAA